MEQIPQPGETPDLETRTRRLSIYNGEKPILDKENQPPTGFQDPIEPADETVESMAEAAAVSHTHDEEDNHDDDDATSVSPSLVSTAATGTGKKKNRKKKPKSKRGLGAPTGFEEYHAEGPLTPAQHAENLELYSPDLPFIDRILRAIQRFEQTKRMDSQRRDIFYKYLAYGGVDVGPNMFQGSIDAEGLDKDSITTALAQTSIAKEKYNIGTPAAKYAVDFSGCLRAFLSRRAMYYYGFETRPQVELATTTLEKFMNYLLHNNVCPEYEADIHEARRIAQKATDELYSIAQVQRWLPGDFNVACSTLFGGTYATKYDGIASWGPDPDDAEELSFVGFTKEVAVNVFGVALATVATEEQYQAYVDGPTKAQEFEVVEVKERAGFEITDITPVTEAHQKFYKENTKDFRPVGIVHARPWRNKATEGMKDLTPTERAEEERAKADPLDQPSWAATGTYTLFLEQSIIQYLFVGMKFEATLRKLRCGIWFMDDFLQAFCSFDTWLSNELMVGWKEPRIRKGAVCFRGEGMGEEEEEEEEEEVGDEGAEADDEVRRISDEIKEGIEKGTAE